MKRSILFYLLISLFTVARAQVGISSSSISPDSSSILELRSTDKGFLVPRMTQTEKGNIAAPAQGLLIYQTDVDTGFWHYQGTTWKQLGAGGSSSANTLDMAYDEGSAGAGRTITADAGAVLVNGTDGLQSTGSFGSGNTLALSGGGAKMFFYPRKASFRAGIVTGSQWNDASIGDYSFAAGYNNIASEAGTFSIGITNNATGYLSGAIGVSASASGSTTLSFGNYTTASGDLSSAFGVRTTAYSGYEQTFGAYNTSYSPNSVTGWNTADRLFVVGNGTSLTNLSDAFTIMKNGDIYGNGNLTLSDGTDSISFPNTDGTSGQVLSTDGSGSLSWTTPASSASGWELTGNGGTSSATDFIGTTDNTDLVFKTNGSENIRINSNGNVGIGTGNGSARLYTYVASSDNSTNYGIYNNYDGTDAGVTYGIYNRNHGSSSATKYGIFNSVNNEGTGIKYGLYNSVSMNSSSNSASYAGYSFLGSYGSGEHAAQYNYLYVYGTTTSTDNGATYNVVDILTPSNTSTIYGSNTDIDSSAGPHYGNYVNLNTGITDSVTYASYNRIYGTGDANHYGVYNAFEETNSANRYGVVNQFTDASASGEIVGLKNEITAGTSTVYGSLTVIDSGTNTIHGHYVNITPASANTDSIYGYYSDLTNTGSGTKFGVYSTVSGSNDYAGYFDGEVASKDHTPLTNNAYNIGSTSMRWDNIYATNGTINTSDIRDKTNIKPVSYGLSTVMQMNPVMYDWKNKSNTQPKIGFIAQELLQTIPEVVNNEEVTEINSKGETSVKSASESENGRLGVYYSDIIPVLTKAIQEQQVMIEELKKNNEIQSKKIEALEKKIAEN